MNIISVIGASGFIGRHFIARLAARKDVEIRVLVHSKKPGMTDKPNIVFIEGDLLKPETLIGLFRVLKIRPESRIFRGLRKLSIWGASR